MQYRITTAHHNTTVEGDYFTIGSDDCLHVKDGNGTVATAPRENLEIIHREGAL